MENGQLFPEHGAESILFATVLNSGHLSGIIFCMFMSYFVKRNKFKKKTKYLPNMITHNIFSLYIVLNCFQAMFMFIQVYIILLI